MSISEKTLPVILIPAGIPFFRIAAREFASLYRKMSGISLRIVTRPSASRDMIVLGSDGENRFVHEKILDQTIDPAGIISGSDSYRIFSAEEKKRHLLFIAGGRNRAVLYGIYHFFELLGCRYFWDGDRIPRKEEISLANWNICETPRFAYRGLRYFAHRSLKRFQAKHWDLADWRKEIDWCLKKRFNLFMLRLGCDDLFQKAFPESVPYPPLHSKEEDHCRSYMDLAPDWSLQYRGKLRKKVLEYAFERDLMHPEDTGTMTHWYSPTPKEFLAKEKPDFLPQSVGNSEDIHLAWDIRQEKHLQNYLKLTETHIREYGKADLFHTIGLAERRCYKDLRKNHELKLYTYRRFIHRLREKYPHAPLLIASWDFAMHWTADEIQALLKELTPENTLLLEYTAETGNMEHNFTHWGVNGKFPWIFGIFHAYEPNCDIRGDYGLIRERLEIAAEDPMCKGLVFWPETSHSDTLMLEYAAANSWNPSEENIRIGSFLPGFVAGRYPEERFSSMLKVWQTFLPVLVMRHFIGPGEKFYFFYQELQFQIEKIFDTPVELTLQLEQDFISSYRENVKNLPELFSRLAAEIPFAAGDELYTRDLVDIARSSAGRLLLYELFTLASFYEEWCRGADNPDRILERICRIRKIYHCFSGILESSPDYSLYLSLEHFREKHPCNRQLETTLKGNADNSYCRSWQFELMKALYIKEFELLSSRMEYNLHHHIRRQFFFREGLSEEFRKLKDDFYATALKEYAPDIRKGVRDLQKNLAGLAELSEDI